MRDNNVSIEFDPFSFSVKDLPTRTVIFRCDITDDLYPQARPASEALSSTTPIVML